MVWSALIPAAVGLGSSLLGSRASRSAANTAAAAADRASEAQLEMFRTNREDLAPFREAGLRGLARFEGELGPSFQQSPGYQFAFQEGANAIDRAASARGMLNSGARLRELTRFGQGMANQEFGNYMNRLASLAGIGQSADAAPAARRRAAQLGANAAAGAANATMAGGQAQAQGITGGANAMFGGLNAGTGLYGLMNPSGWGNVAARKPAGVSDGMF